METPQSKAQRNEEERWLRERWLHEEHRYAPETRACGASEAGNDADRKTMEGNRTNDNICRPTLEKLYAAQRKQKQDLERQIEEAMTGPPQ